MAEKIAIVNQKGGVGKTTTAINTASYLAKRGKRTILIDLDPQGNASSGLGVTAGDEEANSYDLLINDASFDDCLRETGRKNLKICPAHIDLAGAEVELAQLDDRTFRLKKALESSQERVDFIIIDCPPSLGLLTLNALSAADSILIPIQAEYYALEGVSQLMETYERVKASLNPDLGIFGILMTMSDTRTQLAVQVEAEVRKFFGDQVFKTIIPRNVRLSEAPSHGQAILEYDRRSKGAEAYQQLAKEMIRRAKKENS